MHNSIIVQHGIVTFPEFTGERIYMREIIDGKLPDDLKRWEKTLNQMTRGMSAPLAYLMVDQAIVEAGQTHRRPGLHVDGYWNAQAKHGHRPRMHGSAPIRHGASPSPGPSHRAERHSPRKSHGSDTASWADAKFEYPEALLLASTHEGCRAYIGKCLGGIGAGGDCEDADVEVHKVVRMLPNVCYAANVGTLHEAIPVLQTCKRTVVRLNIPNSRI